MKLPQLITLAAVAATIFPMQRLSASETSSQPLYKDPSATVAARVEDLLGRMTLDEKIGQITGVWVQLDDVKKSGLDDSAFFRKIMPFGTGSIGPAQILGADEDVGLRNRMQKFLMEETRLGIPAMFHDEGCHGLVKSGATSFPNPLGLASSWDPGLAERIYTVVAAEMRSRGAQHALTPIVDVARDPRWGRFDETMGEDPYLNAHMGAAVVRGLQGSSDGTVDEHHVLATLKHFTGHGTPEGGLNRSPSLGGPRTLREVDFVPFAYIIRNTHPAAVMPSYNEIDGVPSHANRWLLHDILRGEFGFTGLIVSDYEGVRLLKEGHHVTGSLSGAAALALNAGVQIELPQAAAYPELKDALAKGEVTQAEIDAAVAPILAWKFRLGLFEHPYADVEKAKAVAAEPSSRALALEAARESIVLLKNDGILPLSPKAVRTIAVIGPNADIARLGGYSGTPLRSVSLLEGIRARAGGQVRVLYAQGCVLVKNDSRNAFLSWKEEQPVLATDEENLQLIADAKKAASEADVVVLAIGETESISREAWAPNHLGDAATLALRGSQRLLAEAVLSAGKPVVAYLSNGRPLEIGFLKDHAAAVVEGWYLGEETGTAAAEILFGDISPSGKLTVSFPASAGQIPAYYSKKPYAAPYAYQFSDNLPLWPFGFGLSYTTFRYENVRLAQREIAPGGGTQVSVDVINTGAREADEVVQMYVHQEASSVTRAVKELKGFQRVHLKPGERRTVSFPVTADALALWDINMKFTVEPGDFQIIVGPSSAEGQSATLTVRGP